MILSHHIVIIASISACWWRLGGCVCYHNIRLNRLQTTGKPKPIHPSAITYTYTHATHTSILHRNIRSRISYYYFLIGPKNIIKSSLIMEAIYHVQDDVKPLCVYDACEAEHLHVPTHNKSISPYCIYDHRSCTYYFCTLQIHNK